MTYDTADIFDLNSYDYQLPQGRIATHPVSPRDAAKMLVWENGQANHRVFSDLVDYLDAGDVLVVNNSQVIPARLYGIRPARNIDAPDVNVEILLHKPMQSVTEWTAFARPTKRLRQGDKIILADNVTAEITGRLDEQVTIRFDLAAEDVFPFLKAHGEVPLPPYIERHADSSDVDEYQTVYADAQKPGSVAAPTAGLHFTDVLLQRLRDKNVQITEVTLHVGAGTFLPVTVDDIRQHKMHEEWGQVDAKTVALVQQAKANGKRVVAVGTTATRLLETAARDTGMIQPWVGDTGIFITPGFAFNVVDVLVTNFHLPKSTLLMLVSGFLGSVEEMQNLYKAAIEHDYRFYSYGDACLLTKNG